MERLRAKSRRLTGWLAEAIEAELDDILQILTPAAPERRGCQLSLRVRDGRGRGRQLFQRLAKHGLIADWREPDILRVAPVPLYNTFEDCFELIRQVSAWAAGSMKGG